MRQLQLAALLFTCALVVGFALSGCSDDTNGPAFGTMSIKMTDAPADIDAVNLVITEVAAHFGEGDGEEGWEVLRTDPLQIDAMTLRNGVFTNLAIARVPAGHYTQIRLKLAEGSTVVVDGVTNPLNVPSGLQTGVKLVGSFDVPADGTLELALDFDAARSILLTGAGTYQLKPVIRVVRVSTAGAITGHVLPENVLTTVYAIQAADTIGSTMTTATGNFTLSVLPAGVYSVAFDPGAGYRDTTLVNVGVTAGSTTNVGDVQLTQE